MNTTLMPTKRTGEPHLDPEKPAPSKEKKNRISSTFTIDQETLVELKVFAAKARRDMSDVFEAAILRYINNPDPPPLPTKGLSESEAELIRMLRSPTGQVEKRVASAIKELIAIVIRK